MRLLPVLFALVVASQPAAAQEFSALVSPPRIEASAAPGSVYRDVVEITNLSQATARYTVHTEDWELDDQAQAAFSPTSSPAAAVPGRRSRHRRSRWRQGQNTATGLRSRCPPMRPPASVASR